MFSKVLIAEDKLIGYLLDPDHDKGGAKARFFIEDCGFSPDNPDALANALKPHPVTADSHGLRQTDEGWNYAFICDIQTPNRASICIVSVWCIGQEGGIPHLVTARPLRRRERNARAG